MIAKPNISPDFTIEDIHKIREYHYELTKDMTTQPLLTDIFYGYIAAKRKKD